MSYLRAILKILCLTLWTLPILVVQIIVLCFTKGQGAYIIPQLWHRGVCKIIGLRVEILGTPITDRQIVYVSNHISYLDINVIGAHLRASFIAKEDIAKWPIFGYLATVQQTAFISKNPRAAKQVANSLGDMVTQGKSLILFPEGQVSSGEQILPFKSSLFSLVFMNSDQTLPLQPVVIHLVQTNKNPREHKMTMDDRGLYAWHSDKLFAQHFWNFLRHRGALVQLIFGDPLTPTAGQDRKILSKIIYDQMENRLVNVSSFPHD